MTQDVYKAPGSNVAAAESGAQVLTLAQIWFSFQGRINRRSYWLLYFLPMFVGLMVIFGVLAAIGNDTLMVIVAVPVYIVLIWAGLAVQIKRWHDRNKSGWWVLISFVPVIGPIWALVENGFLAGDDGVNDYGRPQA